MRHFSTFFHFLLSCFLSFVVLSGFAIAQVPMVMDSSNHKVRATSSGVYQYLIQEFDLIRGGVDIDIASAIQIESTEQSVADLSYYKSEHASFPNALTTLNAFTYITPSRGFNSDSYYQQSKAGFYEVAMDKSEREGFDISALSGGSGDSLIIPKQTMVLNSPRMVLKYPATYRSAWTSQYSVRALASLSVAAFGLKNAPMTVVNNWTFRDSIVSWGTAIVPIKGGKASRKYEILISKRWSTREDSVYLAGQPAPKAITDAFGIIQGLRTDGYRYTAFRRDAPNYLFNFVYGSDSTMTTAPFLNISSLAEESTSAVEEGLIEASIGVSPNPAGNVVNISTHKNNDAVWTLRTYSALGVEVDSRLISSLAGDVTIPISVSELQSGTYYVVLFNESNQMVQRQSFVVAR